MTRILLVFGTIIFEWRESSISTKYDEWRSNLLWSCVVYGWTNCVSIWRAIWRNYVLLAPMGNSYYSRRHKTIYSWNAAILNEKRAVPKNSSLMIFTIAKNISYARFVHIYYVSFTRFFIKFKAIYWLKNIRMEMNIMCNGLVNRMDYLEGGMDLAHANY